MNKKINVAEDFSPLPAGRTREDGPNSGQRFREEVLHPIIKNSSIDKITIDFSGIYSSIGSSFLDEAFGYLIRKQILSYDDFKEKFEFVGQHKTVLLSKLEYIIEDSKNIIEGNVNG